ncbi:kinase-like protein [Hanseniaspora valbyensis NRRL Y-1626]|uniref:Casein kinase II subunit alpha n=1 Tax=Hanseniaspora valbyensis NRRL Y-1626 TaxID=766949 RepID=A0A1B7TC67_9ASCO|nr:kinase-like protein [Hanseniaspora valbyensis NRRL Y-1626]
MDSTLQMKGNIDQQQQAHEVVHQSRCYTFAINDILQTNDSGIKELYCNYEMYEGIICNDDQCSEEYRNLKIQPKVNDNDIIDTNTFKKLEQNDIDVNTNKPKMKLEILNKVGRGRYSDVYRVLDINSDKNYVIKFLIPVKRKRVFREILILNNLNLKNQFVSIKQAINVHDNYYYKDTTLKRPYYKLDHNGFENVIKLNHFNCNNKFQYKLIFESAENTDFKSIKFTKTKLKKYTWELLKGIDYIHSMGIMHRDIKPHNICYNIETDTIKIIDFGLAEFYHPLVEYNVRVASRVYKSPELLVNYKKYDYSLDLWSLGCILAPIVFQKDPFFHGKDNNDQLLKIIKVLGTDDLITYMKKYDIRLTGELKKMVNNFEYCVKKPWRKIAMEKCNKDLYDLHFVEFIDGLLCYDHQLRFTAREAMMMSWLDEVRE